MFAYEKKPDLAQLRIFCLKIILLGFLYTASNFGICMLDISAVDEKGVNYKLLLVLDQYKKCKQTLVFILAVGLALIY